MPRQLILHIGLPKTGSSAIQFFLNARRKELLRHGVYCPPTPGGANHSALSLAVEVRNQPRQWANEVKLKGLAAPVRIEDFWRQFEADMKSVPPEAGTVILSAERFGAQLDTPDKIAYLHGVLAPYFGSMRVVVYLRRQDAHATSAYSQTLRFGIIVPPGLDQPRSPYAKFYDYAALLDNWSAVFGEAAMVPRVFERGSLRQGDVLLDFLEICGLGEAALPPVEDPLRNQSINLQGQALLLAMGKMLQEQTGKERVTGSIWDQLTSIVSETCVGQGWRPSRAEANAFLQRYAGSNEAVRQRWFPGRATLFDLTDGSLPDEPVRLDEAPPFPVLGGIILEATRRLVHSESVARVNKAQLARAQGETARAGVLLQQAVQLNGGNVTARLALARHMAEKGDTATAEAHAQAALTAQPDNKTARKLLLQLEKRGPAEKGAR